ncbi:MAG TPA: purine-binding chemotaxis protein CheW [Clostridiales bacterium]|nr:purine-binding chemotaxis protein CheW [Clostridiales bacterium]
MDTISQTSDLEEEETDTNEMKGKFLTFWTDNQLFGIPIADVVQIIGIQEITPIPDSPAYAKGVINLRGNIIPVIDVRLRFSKEETSYNERTCIIVTQIDDNLIGFIVDSVDEVTTIEDNNITPPPRVSKERTNAYLSGIGKLKNKVILLLDTDKILNAEEIEIVSSAVENLAKEEGKKS